MNLNSEIYHEYKRKEYYVALLGEYLTITHTCNYNTWKVNKGKLLDKAKVSSKKRVNTKYGNVMHSHFTFLIDSISNLISKIHYKYERVNIILLYSECI